MLVISGSSNPQLAQNIAAKLGSELVECELSTFGNGERRVFIKGDIKGQNVALIQSFNHPADSHIVEFLLIADALERMGARHVNAVIPWLGYSLQDKVFRDGEPIAAKVVANLVSNAYIKRACLLDLHNTSTPGFFNIPTIHLSCLKTFAQYAQDKIDLSNAVVASPDFGGIKRARVFADELKLDLVNIDKHRNLQTGAVTAHDIHGSVEGKTVLVFDDSVQSGSTVVECAQILKEKGATQVVFFATHGPLVDGAVQKIEASQVDKMVVTNSVDHADLTSTKIEVVDVSELFAQALRTWN